jgi:hypothetical protein
VLKTWGNSAVDNALNHTPRGSFCAVEVFVSHDFSRRGLWPMRTLSRPDGGDTEFRMNRRNQLLCTAAALPVILGGCSSAPRHQASMGMLAQDSKVLSLAAGDSLGRAVYVNDIILAAGKIESDTTYTNVDSGTADVMADPRH